MKKIITFILIICMIIGLVSCGNGKSKSEAKPDPINAVEQYSDVNEGEWYTESVEWGVNEGVIDAAKPTEFGVKTPVSKNEVILAMWKAAGAPGRVVSAKSIPDNDPNSDINKAKEWAEAEKIESYLNGSISGDRIASRLDAINYMWEQNDKPMVTSIEDFDDTKGVDSVEWARAEQITYGTGNNKFSPKDDCTKAHIVTFLFRAK